MCRLKEVNKILEKKEFKQRVFLPLVVEEMSRRTFRKLLEEIDFVTDSCTLHYKVGKKIIELIVFEGKELDIYIETVEEYKKFTGIKEEDFKEIEKI